MYKKLFLLPLLFLLACAKPAKLTYYINDNELSSVDIATLHDTLRMENTEEFMQYLGEAQIKTGPIKYLKKLHFILRMKDGTVETIPGNGTVLGPYKGHYFELPQSLQQKYSISENTFKIDVDYVTPNNAFEFNALNTITKDTLSLVCCDKFMFFPFGEIPAKVAIEKTALRNFKCRTLKREAFMNKDYSKDSLFLEELELNLGNDTLLLFLDNDPTGSIHSYITRGCLSDSSLRFINGLHIGMSSAAFYQLFFNRFPSALNNRFKVVELISCVTSVKHQYHFSEGKLVRVGFIPE